MKYSIKIEYTTSDSFNPPRRQVENLELRWTNIDIAKENLIRINEHFTYYEAQDRFYLKAQKEEITAKSKNQPWYYKEGKAHEAESYLYLKKDDGTEHRICAFWIGYFERLIAAEIVIDMSDMRIEF